LYEGQGAYTTFEIWNTGGGTLSYSLSENCSWVNVAPLSGVSTGEHDTVTVGVNTTGLSPGEYSCNISIFSNGGEGVFMVHVNVSAKPLPPEVTIVRPKENKLYIRNIEITNLSTTNHLTTLIIGPITVYAYANDSDGYVKNVEFYVDNTLEFNDTTRPFTWVWNEKGVVGRHIIRVKAYDDDGFMAQDEIEVIAFNFGFSTVEAYGRVQGKVTEKGKLLEIGLPGVKVTASNGEVTETGEIPFINRGMYSLTLPEGVYEITFEADDYQPHTARNVEVAPGVTTTLNVQLEYICEGCD